MKVAAVRIFGIGASREERAELINLGGAPMGPPGMCGKFSKKCMREDVGCARRYHDFHFSSKGRRRYKKKGGGSDKRREKLETRKKHS